MVFPPSLGRPLGAASKNGQRGSAAFRLNLNPAVGIGLSQFVLLGKKASAQQLKLVTLKARLSRPNFGWILLRRLCRLQRFL